MTKTSQNATFPCSECQAGVLRLRHVTFFTWLGEELITVPNFPAWVCDMCGRREYDERAITWLSALLNPDAGKAPAKVRRSPPASKPRDISRPTPK